MPNKRLWRQYQLALSITPLNLEPYKPLTATKQAETQIAQSQA
ncbi:hypothetical protein VCRA2120O333_40276 [Vibrio crassostreae]|nr:hypothetical protein VCRA2113O326_40185 [Vibrio crassostreae]CAK2811619.1 hypothetical protein VCRA2113O323_20383 [Vibrio crassostreae]CAK3503434.1 hypothetical protein VCRA2123E342_40086 [Vibrio crassostreae]CAK3543839.1 hypothetical protein VCRA2122O341_30261 [Vibrio crassostreae]CAK3632680.1 hypothetical protein VCRA2125O343_30183 [Vibrio crassostreae]